MREVKVTARQGAPADTAADTRVVGLFEGETLAEEPLQALVELGEAKPGLKRVAVAHEDAPGGGRRRVLVAGSASATSSTAKRSAWPRPPWPAGPRSSAPCR